MNYTIKTKHQDGKNYVCNSTENIVPALNYAIEMTKVNQDNTTFFSTSHEECPY